VRSAWPCRSAAGSCFAFARSASENATTAGLAAIALRNERRSVVFASCRFIVASLLVNG
jgi:hypothetical protein